MLLQTCWSRTGYHHPGWYRGVLLFLLLRLPTLLALLRGPFLSMCSGWLALAESGLLVELQNTLAMLAVEKTLDMLDPRSTNDWVSAWTSSAHYLLAFANSPNRVRANNDLAYL